MQVGFSPQPFNTQYSNLNDVNDTYFEEEKFDSVELEEFRRYFFCFTSQKTSNYFSQDIILDLKIVIYEKNNELKFITFNKIQENKIVWSSL